MDERAVAPGFAALLTTIRLIQRLVFRSALIADEARELADAGVLDAETMLGKAPQAAFVRELLTEFLNAMNQRPSA